MIGIFWLSLIDPDHYEVICMSNVICKYDILYVTHRHVFGKSLEAKKKTKKTNVGFGIIFVFYPSCYLTVTAAGCAAVTPSRGVCVFAGSPSSLH